jgi:NADPH:quinone reductase-like Zn-dependent oxidoreductase
MKAIIVTDQAAGTAGMKLVERPEPQPAINDIIVQVHASGFTGDELTWHDGAVGRTASVWPH